MAIVASARIRRVVHKPDVQNKWDDNTNTHSDSPPIEHVTWYLLRLPHLTLPYHQSMLLMLLITL